MTVKEWKRVSVAGLISAVAVMLFTNTGFLWGYYNAEMLPIHEWHFAEYPYELHMNTKNGTGKSVHLGVTDYLGCIRITRLDRHHKPNR